MRLTGFLVLAPTLGGLVLMTATGCGRSERSGKNRPQTAGNKNAAPSRARPLAADDGKPARTTHHGVSWQRRCEG